MTRRTRKLAVGAVVTVVAIAVLAVWAGGGRDEPRIEAKVLRHDDNYAVIRFKNASRSATRILANPSYSPSPGVTNFMVGYGSVLKAHEEQDFPLVVTSGANTNASAIRITYHRWRGQLYARIEPFLNRLGVQSLWDERRETSIDLPSPSRLGSN